MLHVVDVEWRQILSFTTFMRNYISFFEIMQRNFMNNQPYEFPNQSHMFVACRDVVRSRSLPIIQNS